MKKIFLITLTAALGFSSCRTPYSLSSIAVDYSKYSEKGFFITEANSVSFEYKPVASISSTFITGYDYLKVDGKVVMRKDTEGNPVIPRTTNKLILATKEGAMEELYKKATELGANGIINFKVVKITSTKNNSSSGYEVSGMAIKR